MKKRVVSKRKISLITHRERLKRAVRQTELKKEAELKPKEKKLQFWHEIILIIDKILRRKI